MQPFLYIYHMLMTRIIQILFLFALLACSNDQEPANLNIDPPAGKLFIIGGGKRPLAMIKELVELSKINKEGYGIILPMSSEEPDSSIFYAKVQFTDLGLENVFGMNLIKDKPATQQQLDSIKRANLIYISGGDQNRFMEIVYQTPVETAIKEAYKNGSIIAGTSAGAAVMSQKMITGNELKYPVYEETFRNIESNNIEIKPGLGLIETAIIDQHFIKRSRYNRLISAVIEYPEMLGIGIDESTAIVVHGDSARVIGESQVILFRNPDDSQEDNNGLLGAKGLTLDVLLPGSKFSISNN